MRLRGMDPTRGGRNQDIDFTRVGVDPEKITTTIDYRQYWDVKIEASAAHGSQGGGTSMSRLLPGWIQRQIFGKENFIRAHPPVPEGFHESDLFNSK
jgi:LmbE family N-acetylglucosaminyl deacetylase